MMFGRRGPSLSRSRKELNWNALAPKKNAAFSILFDLGYFALIFKYSTLNISKICCWFWYFTTLGCRFRQLLGTHWSHQKHAWMLSYFAQSQYILVRLGWSGWMGRKSMVMCKISTTPNQASMLQIVPIMCPTPQPSVVKNWSKQEFFLRYLMYIH